MRLNKLALRGFSAHLSTDLEFTEPVTVITGRLNSGKSSIAQAIEIALTGACERYRKRTDDQSQLIHDVGGTERFSVRADLDCGTVTRAKGAAGATTITFEDKTGQDATVALQQALHVKTAVVTTLLNTADFFDLDHKDQKEMILSLIGAEVRWDEIREKFTAAGHDAAALKVFPVGDVNSVAGLDSIYKDAFTERTLVTRELKELKPAAPPEGDRPPVDAIKSKIDGLERQRAEATEKLGALRSKATGNQKDAVGAEILRLEMELAGLRVVTDAELADAKAAVDSAWKATQEAAGRRAAASEVLLQAQAQLMVHQKNVRELTNFNGRCVAGPHACPVDVGTMQAARAQEELEVESLRLLVAEGSFKMAGFERAATDQTATRATEAKLKDLERAQEKTAAKVGAIDKFRKTLSSMADPEDVTDRVDEAEEVVRMLDERIKAGRAHLETGQAWLYRQSEVEKVAARRATLEAKKRHLESLCEFFGPTGVKVSLIDEKIAGFQAAVNAALQYYGFAFQFQAEPWVISAKGHPVARLSRSERFRLGVAMQVAVAKITGLNFVLIDNMEILDGATRSATLGLLAQSGVQACCLLSLTMATEEEFLATRKQPVPGVGFYLVRNQAGVATVEQV